MYIYTHTHTRVYMCRPRCRHRMHPEDAATKPEGWGAEEEEEHNTETRRCGTAAASAAGKRFHLSLSEMLSTLPLQNVSTYSSSQLSHLLWPAARRAYLAGRGGRVWGGGLHRPPSQVSVMLVRLRELCKWEVDWREGGKIKQHRGLCLHGIISTWIYEANQNLPWERQVWIWQRLAAPRLSTWALLRRSSSLGGIFFHQIPCLRFRL